MMELQDEIIHSPSLFACDESGQEEWNESPLIIHKSEQHRKCSFQQPNVEKEEEEATTKRNWRNAPPVPNNNHPLALLSLSSESHHGNREEIDLPSSIMSKEPCGDAKHVEYKGRKRKSSPKCISELPQSSTSLNDCCEASKCGERHAMTSEDSTAYSLDTISSNNNSHYLQDNNGWRTFHDSNGIPYHYNFHTGESVWALTNDTNTTNATNATNNTTTTTTTTMDHRGYYDSFHSDNDAYYESNEIITNPMMNGDPFENDAWNPSEVLSFIKHSRHLQSKRGEDASNKGALTKTKPWSRHYNNYDLTKDNRRKPRWDDDDDDADHHYSKNNNKKKRRKNQKRKRRKLREIMLEVMHEEQCSHHYYGGIDLEGCCTSYNYKDLVTVGLGGNNNNNSYYGLGIRSREAGIWEDFESDDDDGDEREDEEDDDEIGREDGGSIVFFQYTMDQLSLWKTIIFNYIRNRFLSQFTFSSILGSAKAVVSLGVEWTRRHLIARNYDNDET